MFSWGEAGVERLGEFRWVAFWLGRCVSLCFGGLDELR